LYTAENPTADVIASVLTALMAELGSTQHDKIDVALHAHTAAIV
jgi:hypothetical protein